MMHLSSKWIIFLFLFISLFFFYYNHSAVACPASVKADLDITSEQLSVPAITVEIEENRNSIVIHDYYWNPQNSYSTIRAFAKYRHKKLIVSIIHDTAPDELQSMGSNTVIVEVMLPEELKSAGLKTVIVKSRDSREGQIKKEFFIDSHLFSDESRTVR